MSENYNVNAMRKAFKHARLLGNRGPISKAMCEELGISEGYFALYTNNMTALYAAVIEYCKLKNAPVELDDDRIGKLKTAYDAIFAAWKTLLQSAEKDHFDKDLRVSENDVTNLVGFTQMFIRDRNDRSMGEDKNFVAKQAWANDTLRHFATRVETDLGIRIAKVDAMTDEERDFLRTERSAINKVRKNNDKYDTLVKRKDELTAIKKKLAGTPAESAMDEAIKALDDEIAENRKAHDVLVEALEKLDAPQALKDRRAKEAAASDDEE